MKTPRSTRTSFEFDRDLPAWLVRIEQVLRPLSIDLHKPRRLGVFDDFLRFAAKRRILGFFSVRVYQSSMPHQSDRPVRAVSAFRYLSSLRSSRRGISRITKWCGFS